MYFFGVLSGDVHEGTCNIIGEKNTNKQIKNLIKFKKNPPIASHDKTTKKKFHCLNNGISQQLFLNMHAFGFSISFTKPT